MTDPQTTIAERLDALRATLERPTLAADITVGYDAEASTPDMLADRLESAIRGIARDEDRPIVGIEFGGMVRTDDGWRCWCTLNLAAIGTPA